MICGIGAAVILVALVITLVIILKKSDTSDSSDSGGTKDDSPSPIKVAANRTQSQNNLKQIGLALYSYHDAYKQFPPAIINDGLGNPARSWRVAILPYLGEDPPFPQWNELEPWNGPNNILISSRIPKCFQLPGKVNDGKQTYYQVFTGEATAFGPPGGARVADFFMNGTSNIILVVEAARPVPWYAPEDIPFTSNPNGLDPKLFGGHFGKGVNVLLGDGSVRVVPFSMSPFDFQNAITRNSLIPVKWPD